MKTRIIMLAVVVLALAARQFAGDERARADAVRLVGKGRAALTIGTRAASKLLVEVPTVR